ncbi:MAG: DUF6873 family GME fold protein [Candidatus Omnitrophota bacterium]
MKIIPIFIPHAGCPYKCIYCDQNKISGAVRLPSKKEVQSIIDERLKTIPKEEVKEIAFFGGTFTSLPNKLQEEYLRIAHSYVKKGVVDSIRMSTHPESVTKESMKRFKRYGGRLVELGIQSLDKKVLKSIKREVDLKNVKDAVEIIKSSGLKLGVQVMLGLPGDTLKRSIDTAKRLVRFKPETARIYPALVIEGTELAGLYKKRKYKPMALKRAIEEASVITDIFEKNKVKVIRIGLHPSRDLESKETLLAGPYHVNFGSLVRSRIMQNKTRDVKKDIALIDPRMPRKAKEKLKCLNFNLIEVPLHKRLQKPIKGHTDMMIFKYNKTVVYEPRLEKIARILRLNGYKCIKGDEILSGRYPKDIIYNACSVGRAIIHYKGDIDKHIKSLKAGHILVNQGYAKCSIVPVDNKRIITSDTGIANAWTKKRGMSLLVKPGHVKLPGYKAGFIGGATGVTDKTVFFVGRLDTHPDSRKIRSFIKKSGKSIVELYEGPLYDVGSVVFFDC